MSQLVLGILAHVDAGKTTLAEAILYQVGKLRKLGRVDHGDTALDTHTLERERGITIFASQANFTLGDMNVTLLDTPGHVDFSAEAERTLQVLDYAVLVISGIDGVQAHTRTLWKLLEYYRVPTFLFITKMDLSRQSRENLMAQVKDLSPNCIDFSAEASNDRDEALAMCREDLLETYLSEGKLSAQQVRGLIRARQAFPCFFGSGLKLEGIADFLESLQTYTEPTLYPSAFGARVFKISHDAAGNRLTHIKVTGGSIKVRDSVLCNGQEEKISQIRLYTGAKFATCEEVKAGGICALLGLNGTQNGQGLGREAAAGAPVLEPVMNYRLRLPAGCDARTMLPKLRQLEEEDPQLHITWVSHLQEIHVGLMGEVQTEILRSLIAERFNVDVTVDNGRVVYKETITDTVEGVGHFEPLRHYAEVHLLLEPLPRGTGLQFATKCSEDALDRNWQRLVLTHLYEKQHIGVLTGSPITDMKITLVSGRAHLKHTEGGDFRQATYRAVRQGLMQAQTVLLEPYYRFRLELPSTQLGRAMNDIRARFGSVEPPQTLGDVTVLCGKAPVTALGNYAAEVAAYTGGQGKLFCEVAGYEPCHNTEEVVCALAYQPEADLDNTPDSVFCAHGGGFPVKWQDVPKYMHLESYLQKPREPFTGTEKKRSFSIDDEELEAILSRIIGNGKKVPNSTPAKNTAPIKTEPFLTKPHPNFFIVDGYNVIFAWEDLRALAQLDLDAARTKLMHVLCNFAAYTQSKVVLVFDAYRVSGNTGQDFAYHNIRVIYTKENETGDACIEKMLLSAEKDELIRVVTSDWLIQVSALSAGVLRMSALEFEKQVRLVEAEMEEVLEDINRTHMGSVAENFVLRQQ